tara:strand:+ start:271 stop:603 length:333 start_codon:yes stop_codon:yes gene_type:complete
VVKKDKKDVFRFTSLQSEKGQELLNKYQVNPVIDSVVLVERDSVYVKSTAAFRILKTLGGLKSIFYVFIVVPAFIRDFFYDVVAKYRYQWFGKNDCEFLPNQNMKNKFLM